MEPIKYLHSITVETTRATQTRAVSDGRMTSKRFLLTTATFVSIFVLVIVSVNVYFDLYGVFRDAKGRALAVHYNERISKYLLSYQYIPDNYQGVVIGTSLSANVDVTPDTHELYNASVMGANIGELRPILQKCVDGGIKKVIFCLSPYMLKDADAKEVELSKKLYYSALGSKNLLETYIVAGIRHFDLLPGKYPKDQIDANGVNRFEKMYLSGSVDKKIEDVLSRERSERFILNDKAIEVLKDIVALMHDNGIEYGFYFHPVPKKFYEGKLDHYQEFENTIREIISADKIVDFNSEDYAWFTENDANYVDHGHLSSDGSKKLGRMLNERFLNQN